MTVNTHTPDILGAEVYRTNGEKIGRAEHVYLDRETSQPAWVTVMTGLFGNHQSVVPITNADVSNNRISVLFSKEHIRDSPTVEPVDAHLTTDDELSLNVHYGLNYPS